MAKQRRRGRNDQLTTWTGSLHKSFRILPTGGFSNDDLLAFLKCEEGASWQVAFNNLPFDSSRSQRPAASDPDAKRYRDPRQVFENCGLLWEDDARRIRFTELGRTLRRFMPHATERNVALIAQHGSLALNICQLRNPTGAGQRFHASMAVFPFRFIWLAMLKLDNRINSDELNRAIFATRNSDMLPEAIERIRSYRRTSNVSDLGTETVSGRGKNDRIIPIVSIASFGWTLLNQKDTDGYYTIKPDCVQFLCSAVNVPVIHRDYTSVEEYVTRISQAAALPKDVR